MQLDMISQEGTVTICTWTEHERVDNLLILVPPTVPAGMGITVQFLLMCHPFCMH